MTTATLPRLRELDDNQLSEAWHVGAVDLATLTAECARRDRADRSAAKRKAERSEWYDAAHAQYLAADAQCRGNLLSDLGRREDIGQAMTLWTGSDAWADARASEELRAFWDANGGRLSLANYRRQQASQARAYRNERDLDRMTAAPVAEPRPVQRAPRTAPRPVRTERPAPRPAGSIARYITALGAVERQADRTAARIEALAAHLRRDAA